MPEPTLTELREMAVGCRGILASRGHSDALTVLDAFLALTDPTPLTAEHCREAGASSVRLGNDMCYVMPGFCAWNDGGRHASCEITNATRGQLRLALMMEASDGE